jgi:hypothetical protein
VPKERVLITVKTYLTLSEKHKELACTAGFRLDGSWIRLYPIPFRLLEEEQRYKKYQWVEVDTARNLGDSRPESHRVLNTENITLHGTLGTEDAWAERRKIVFLGKTYTNLAELIGLAKSNTLSLATFKPAEVIDFIFEEAAPEWAKEKIDAVLANFKQGNLFEGQNSEDFKIMPKLPYKFSYKFKDDAGKVSTLMIEDWEIGQLYWNCLKRHDAQTALKKVKQKYFDDFVKTKDLYLFLGTTREWHGRAKNPFVIIGTFHPPPIQQPRLL